MASELLENAMKFSYAPLQYAISIEMYLEEDQIIFYATNSVDPKTIEDFQTFIQRLLTEDTHKLYLEQLTRNAEHDAMEVVLDIFDVQEILSKFFFSDLIGKFMLNDLVKHVGRVAKRIRTPSLGPRMLRYSSCRFKGDYSYEKTLNKSTHISKSWDNPTRKWDR
jgi:hypothetical protein